MSDEPEKFKNLEELLSKEMMNLIELMGQNNKIDSKTFELEELRLILSKSKSLHLKMKTTLSYLEQFMGPDLVKQSNEAEQQLKFITPKTQSKKELN